MEALKEYGGFGLAALIAVGGLVAPEGTALIYFLSAAVVASASFVLKSTRGGIGAAAFLAFGANAYLFSLKLEAAAGPSICNINSVLNCDAVNASAASEMFGVPITLFGMGYYLGLGLASMLKPGATPRLFQVNTLFSVVSLVFSAYLAWETKKLGVVCVMCLTIYASNIILFWAGMRGLRQLQQRLTQDLDKLLFSNSFVTITVTYAAVLLVGLSTWSGHHTGSHGLGPSSGGHTPGATASQLDPKCFGQPRGEIGLAGDEPILGDPNAPYLVVEFADYACPHCAAASKEIKQLVKQVPQVQVRFRPFPLTAACNPALKRDSGPERCDAAMAAECALPQGKFWELSSLIFANQTRLSQSDLAFMAEQVGLDIPTWTQCLDDPKMQAGLQADALAGAKAGVMGTPTMFLKGTHGDAWVEVYCGAGGVLDLVNAHMDGKPMPTPGPPQQL